jgi:lipopolysaccharide/colanic/teichoic acid biosynthesis glycosyltransferase/carbonic anhydrase/acetyltransferase-like protein (isoleucine patch superfamily)
MVGNLPPRAALRSEHQALVVVERRRARHDDPRKAEEIPGWKWVLGNSRVADLYDRMLAEARLTWSCLVVPQEQKATFASLAAPTASRQSLAAYDGQLQLHNDNLAVSPETGEPVFLIFNGHGFPMCDLAAVIAAHRQGRCDATMVDFPLPRRQAYEEKLRIDSAGQVQRVDRSYYNNTGAPPAAGERDWPPLVVLSAAAMQQLLNVVLPQRFGQWPMAMLRAGLRLRGVTVPGRCFDLADREHLYELNEMVLRLKPHWLCEAGGLVDQGQKIWVGRNVRIASSAQLIGPVAIGDDVEIGSEAVLVGPTTVGRGCRIGANVVLKRCVVMPDTTLASAAPRAQAISHAIVLGSDTPSIHTITAGPSDVRALEIDRPIKLETVLEAGASPGLSGFRYDIFRATKRLMDILGSVILLAVTLPFYPLIALAIKLNSPGPIFYYHTRQGRGGRNFRCWKFRTMVPNADEIKRALMARNEVDGPQFKIKDDPRIFAVGRFLRKYNLDEWPQFFNVLVGQMSLVGPRPSPDRENQMCPAWRDARLSVRPGITGLWQVMRNRERGDTDFQEWIYYDVQYVKKQSVWLDLKIVFKTLSVIFCGRGT